MVGRTPISRLAALVLMLPFAVSQAGCGRVLLDERFHDKRQSAWLAVDDPDVLEGPSRWEVEADGRLHQHSNVWGRRGDFLGRWYGTYLVAGDPTWDDYDLWVKATPGDDDGFGVVFRFTDAGHFYRLILLEDGFSGGPITRLDKRDGADYTELWSAPRGYKKGVETVIHVRVTEDRISGDVDGRPLFEVRDRSYRRGKVGLFCYAQRDQAFDDVKVRGN